MREDLFSATFFAVFLAEGERRIGSRCERIEFSCEIQTRANDNVPGALSPLIAIVDVARMQSGRERVREKEHKGREIFEIVRHHNDSDERSSRARARSGTGSVARAVYASRAWTGGASVGAWPGQRGHEFSSRFGFVFSPSASAPGPDAAVRVQGIGVSHDTPPVARCFGRDTANGIPSNVPKSGPHRPRTAV